MQILNRELHSLIGNMFLQRVLNRSKLGNLSVYWLNQHYLCLFDSSLEEEVNLLLKEAKSNADMWFDSSLNHHVITKSFWKPSEHFLKLVKYFICENFFALPVHLENICFARYLQFKLMTRLSSKFLEHYLEDLLAIVVVFQTTWIEIFQVHRWQYWLPSCWT